MMTETSTDTSTSTESARGGLVVLSEVAPDVATALARLVEIRPLGVHDALLQAPAVRTFAERFRAGVSTVDDRVRADFVRATGEHHDAVAQMVWIGDAVPRLRAALDALYGASAWHDPRRFPVADPGAAIAAFVGAVARLGTLDATLTELVRLRGARRYDSRRGRSRRSAAALEHGATEADFTAVDDHEHSDLDDDAKAALMLTDAMIGTPDDVPARTLAAVRERLVPARAAAVVAQVTCDSLDKLAVALGTDASEVDDGVQLFTTDVDGTVLVSSR